MRKGKKGKKGKVKSMKSKFRTIIIEIEGITPLITNNFKYSGCCVPYILNHN